MLQTLRESKLYKGEGTSGCDRSPGVLTRAPQVWSDESSPGVFWQPVSRRTQAATGFRRLGYDHSRWSGGMPNRLAASRGDSKQQFS